MLVVPPPATWDDMVVEVSEAFLESFDPGAEFVPMLGDLGSRNVWPVSCSRDVVHLIDIDRLEDRLDSIELKPRNDSVVSAGDAHPHPSRAGSASPDSS